MGISKYLDNLWMISICLDNLCDGISGKGNCKDGSDEDPLHCNSPTQVNDQWSFYKIVWSVYWISR